jgi:hypothetical protein
MRRRMMVSLFVLMIAFTFTTTTFGQARPDASTPPPASSDNGERSNKGGQLRGLDRADQAAGQHGQQGRERARDAQLNRQTHPERSGVLERPMKPERPGR